MFRCFYLIIRFFWLNITTRFLKKFLLLEIFTFRILFILNFFFFLFHLLIKIIRIQTVRLVLTISRDWIFLFNLVRESFIRILNSRLGKYLIHYVPIMTFLFQLYFSINYIKIRIVEDFLRLFFVMRESLALVIWLFKKFIIHI